ncbi:MAG: lysophospholipid acyltransferase family protein [Acidimicrobiales bacterium]
MILYQVVRAGLRAIGWAFFGLRVQGRENVPRTGAFVLAPVHRSFIDFALVSGVTRRRMRYMGKDSLFRVAPFAWLIRHLGAYPVHRGTADREALRRTIEVVSGGEPVVIFPEGTRRSGPRIESLFEGAAYVAARTGVPIVPVGIGGSERALPKGRRLPRPVRIQLVVGSPLSPPLLDGGRGDGARLPRRVVHELTEQLHAELQRLFDEAQRRAGVSVAP